MLSDTDKEALWQAYRDRKPSRVPVTLAHNPRIVVQDPALNVDGYTYAQVQTDPLAHVRTNLRWQLHTRTTLDRFTDGPTGLPEVWDVNMSVYNMYEAAYFGAEIFYDADQVPDAHPPFTDEARKHDVFKFDIDHPLENPFIKRCLAFHKEIERVCEGMRFEGRPVRVAPWTLGGTDGPVTVGCNLRGSDFLVDMAADPGYARRLLRFVTDAAIKRRQAFYDYWGDKVGRGNWYADDSIACLSTAMYDEMVLPEHRRFYEAGPPGVRSMHLCGDATRHFPAIHQKLGVTSFDTGFPVDFGDLRRQLGPDTEIMGGVEVALLLSGTPEEVYRRATQILQSGVKEGGRFVLKEANNLPPRCPLANLEAMYQAALDHGGY